MKVEIEISEEVAEALLSDHWHKKTIEQILVEMAEDAAQDAIGKESK